MGQESATVFLHNGTVVNEPGVVEIFWYGCVL